MNTQVLRILLLIAVAAAAPTLAQPTNTSTNRFRGPQGPQFRSPEVMADRRVAFRILAAKAETVRLGAGDIQGLGQNTQLKKGTNGVWEIVVGPVDPGAYRYNFSVDGVTVIDPRNPTTSESNGNTWSLVHVAGADFMDTKDLPHGAIAEVTYYSTALKRFRRMHVYTPPGYESGKGKFPIFYLLHGAGDSDDSWSSIGRAGFILDNLIGAKKAKPMVVVMPAGHTREFSFGGARIGGTNDEFLADFRNDIMPYAEKNYRVYTDQKRRAVAGLSMGGAQTLNIAFGDLSKFGYVGVYSSGIFGIAGGGFGRRGDADGAPAGPSWEEQHKRVLDDPKLKKGVKLVWFATGKDDRLIGTTRASVEMLKKHNFKVTFNETPGAHTWIVWRQYLNEFAPQLFQ